MGSQAAPTVAIVTLGCKLNQADSEAIARQLAGDGVRVATGAVPGADAYIVNSCSVTHVADRKARHLVRYARRLSPRATVVLTGCYAASAPEGLADAIVPNAAKPFLAERLLARLRERGDPAGGCGAPAPQTRTRAFVKIQEGCNELCAFCIVPYTRGRERSVPVEDVLREVRSRQAEGVKEVVLTGTQLGNYGRDLGWRETGPRRLLEALLDGTSLPRIRLSSLQPQDITPALLRLWRDRRLCPHFHIPLQSGSDAVLRAMRRRYTAGGYLRAVEMIREHVPGVAITTDVIAGFPGESEADFEATLRVIEEAAFAAIHPFPYSRRPGTAAALMKNHLPPQLRRQRLERLLAAASAASAAFRSQFLGHTLEVLWEQEDPASPGRWTGLTGNYIRVYTLADADLANRLLPARLTRLEDAEVRAEIQMALEPAT